MKSLSDLFQEKPFDLKEERRKDKVRRALVKELVSHLNKERERENESKVTKYIWTHHVPRLKALEMLGASREPTERIWAPYTERGIYFKTRHVDEQDLRELFDKCNAAEKDSRSFGKVFNGSLKVH